MMAKVTLEFKYSRSTAEKRSENVCNCMTVSYEAQTKTDFQTPGRFAFSAVLSSSGSGGDDGQFGLRILFGTDVNGNDRRRAHTAGDHGAKLVLVARKVFFYNKHWRLLFCSYRERTTQHSSRHENDEAVKGTEL